MSSKDKLVKELNDVFDSSSFSGNNILDRKQFICDLLMKTNSDETNIADFRGFISCLALGYEKLNKKEFPTYVDIGQKVSQTFREKDWDSNSELLSDLFLKLHKVKTDLDILNVLESSRETLRIPPGIGQSAQLKHEISGFEDVYFGKMGSGGTDMNKALEAALKIKKPGM